MSNLTKSKFLEKYSEERGKGYKVEELKEFCRQLGLRVSGNKAQLNARLTDNFCTKTEISENDKESKNDTSDSSDKVKIKPAKKSKKLEPVNNNINNKAIDKAKIIAGARKEVIKNENDIKEMQKHLSCLNKECDKETREKQELFQAIEEKKDIINKLNNALYSTLEKERNLEIIGKVEEDVNPVGQKIRKHLIVNLIKIFTTNAKLNNEDVKNYSLDIEKGIYEHSLHSFYNKIIIPDWNNYGFKSLYVNRALLITSNLNPRGSTGNLKVLNFILNKDIDPYELGFSVTAKMMFPERNEREKILAGEKHYSEMDDGIIQCPDPECLSMKTSYKEIMTRSADEPATIFANCFKCGNRWKQDN